MPTLVLGFTGRRYHATPWGHHVNEGQVEWPPSPWRVLRALISAGYTKLGWVGSPDGPMDSELPLRARTLFTKLASVLPVYSLPAATTGHSRHYMPIGNFKADGLENTTLVIDTWAQVDEGELAMNWDVELEPEELALFKELTSKLGYLGRSESWVHARVVDDPSQWCFGCRPEAGTSPPGFGWEQVALLAPISANEYSDWRAACVERAVENLPLPSNGRPSTALTRKREAAASPFPVDLMACLRADTAFLRTHGWSQPPGAKRVFYWRPADALRSVKARRSQAESKATGSVQTIMVLLSLATQSGNLHALPMVRRSLPQGELLHRQLVGLRARIATRHSPVLTGCDDTGMPLAGQHRHLHVLSLDLDGDGHIDHVLLWAEDGFDAVDLRAISTLRTTFTKGGVGPIRIGWAGSGTRATMMALAQPFGDSIRRVVGSSMNWVSASPFVAPRYLKASGRNTIEGQVRAELASRGIEIPVKVQVIDATSDDRARQQRHFVRSRGRGPQPPVDAAFTLRLSFAEPVEGPLCLGYSSHFGLGRFEIGSD
jgi:CRISPR-associated protein Csb2